MAHEATWQILNRPSHSIGFGLLRLEITVPADVICGKISLRFGGASQGFQTGDLVTVNGGTTVSLRIHLVTQLVMNGSHFLETELHLSHGETIYLPPVEIEIQNVGPLAAWVRSDLSAYGTPPIIGKFVDSKLFPSSSMQSVAWFNRPENIQDVPLSLKPAIDTQSAYRHLARWGFTILDYRIPVDTISSFRREYQEAIDSGRLVYKKGTSQRIELAHRLPVGRQIWLDSEVLEFLSGWFRDEPCACQTLLYVHGSEQDPHQDTIHLSPYPDGYMCGVWIALQDIEPGSGELFVYPGSHRTERATTANLGLAKVSDDYSSYSALTDRMNSVLNNGHYHRLEYLPKAGEILVWHENLIHGGAKRVYPGRERHSIVSHYFARGGVAYYDSRGEGANLERVK
jgi:hypothetical protein